MRELIFRAINTLDGQWVIGMPRRSAMGNWFIDNAEWATSHPVNPDTIGQWTGFKDIDGNYIFEGDALTSDDMVCYVRWNDSVGAFCVQFTFEDECGSAPLGEWLSEKRFKVTGNIHENSV